jgi:two-component system, cell cycle sensor histidine kinase PleC
MADAQRGRAAGGWTRLKFPGMAAWGHEATGQAKIFAGPAARHLTRAEPVLKRSIPILIVAFLFVVAISRMVGIMVEHDRMETSVRDTTSLTAMAVGAVFSGTMAESLAKSDRMAVEAALSLNIPQDRMQPGGLVLFVEEKGRVFGASLAAARYVGQSLARFSPELAATQYFGEPASVFRTRIGGQDYYASLVQMPKKGGFVIVANPLGQIALFWRDEVALNVTLFAGISAILLVILYAYYIQAKRRSPAAAAACGISTCRAAGCSGRAPCMKCSACRHATACCPLAMRRA